MDFVKFLLGKRLLEDELTRGLNAAAQLPSVRKRHIEAAIQAALDDLNSDGIAWKTGGEVEPLPDGTLSTPKLPHSPGIVRIDTIGPGPTDYAIGLSEHASMASEESTWDSDPELIGQMLAGTRFVVSYIDTSDQVDLATEAGRRALIRSIEVRADASDHWFVQTVDDRNILILAGRT